MINYKMILKMFFLMFSVPFVRVSSKDYCSLPCSTPFGQAENSACDCSFGPQCQENTERLTPDAATKKYIVEIHNKFRQDVASGSHAPQPPASNMFALVYDDELAHVAECFASKCIFGHDECRRTETFQSVGQNAMKGTNMQCDEKEIFRAAISGWFNEIKDVTENCINDCTGCTNHYTQIVWAKTTSVGCARVRSASSCFIFCNYGPAGNVLGQSVYQKGDPTCETHKVYRHLCKGKAEEEQGSSANETQGSSANKKPGSSASCLFLKTPIYVFQLCAFFYFGRFI